jgi:hypothetical protein
MNPMFRMKEPRDPFQNPPDWLEKVWSGGRSATERERIKDHRDHLERSPGDSLPAGANGALSNKMPECEGIDSVQLEIELSLNRALRATAAPRATSNFARRVVEAAILETPIQRADPIRGGFSPWVSGWVAGWVDFGLTGFRALLRFAPTSGASTIAAVGIIGLIAWFQWQGQQRTRLAQSVATMAHSAQATESTDLPAYLRDFDAIQVVGAAPRPDDVALLTALSQ